MGCWNQFKIFITFAEYSKRQFRLTLECTVFVSHMACCLSSVHLDKILGYVRLQTIYLLAFALAIAGILSEIVRQRFVSNRHYKIIKQVNSMFTDFLRIFRIVGA